MVSWLIRPSFVIEAVPVPDLGHGDNIAARGELDAVVAGADAELTGQVAAQGLGAADVRVVGEALENPQHARPDGQRQRVELSSRLVGQDHRRHARYLTGLTSVS